MTVEQRAQRVGEVADRIDVAHLAIGNQAGEQRPVLRADLVPGEEGIFPCQTQLPFILPMSGRFIGFIIDGMPILART